MLNQALREGERPCEPKVFRGNWGSAGHSPSRLWF